MVVSLLDCSNEAAQRGTRSFYNWGNGIRRWLLLYSCTALSVQWSAVHRVLWSDSSRNKFIRRNRSTWKEKKKNSCQSVLTMLSRRGAFVGRYQPCCSKRIFAFYVKRAVPARCRHFSCSNVLCSGQLWYDSRLSIALFHKPRSRTWRWGDVPIFGR